MTEQMNIRVGILTVSDRSARGERADLSGPALQQYVTRMGWSVVHQAILPDELDELKALLSKWADQGDLDVILTTGGTGFAPRDVTPEATQAVIERPAPGLAEAMRAPARLRQAGEASRKITRHAILSRAIAGIRKRTLILNLPGSPKGALENLEEIIDVLPHAIQLLREDPNSESGHQK